MPIRSTQELVIAAEGASAAVPAFNVITLEHAEAIAAAAELTGLPVIFQISENAVKFHGGHLAPIAAASLSVAQSSTADIALHLDHVEDFALLEQAPECGFSSAMFDAGSLPYAENVDATRRAVEWAEGRQLWLEAELGYVGGKDGAPQSAHAKGVRTDPEEAQRFVAETGVASLAVAVGSSHAMTSQTAQLDLDLIARLHGALDVPLVLHGSSGVPLDQITAAVAAGMRKINVGTALNIAYTGAIREHLSTSEKVDPRPYLALAREAIVTAITPLIEAIARPH